MESPLSGYYLRDGEVEEREEHPVEERVPIQLPAEPPLMDVVVGSDEQRLPGAQHEDLLEEHLEYVINL